MLTIYWPRQKAIISQVLNKLRKEAEVFSLKLMSAENRVSDYYLYYRKILYKKSTKILYNSTQSGID
jgi:hypothetical protein